MSGIKAIQVPAMVASHQGYLGSRDYLKYMDQMMLFDLAMLKRRLDDKDVPLTLGNLDMATLYKLRDNGGLREFEGAFMCQQESDRLNIATLFHVSESMLAVSMQAARKLDEDQDIWCLESLPSRTGFMVFERPLYHLDARGMQTACAAIAWHVYHRVVDDMDSIEFTFYAPPHDWLDAYGMAIEPDVNLGPFHFLGTGAMPMHHTIGPMTVVPPDPVDLDAVLQDVDGMPHEARYMQRAAIAAESVPDANGLVPYPVECTNLYRVAYSIFLLMQQTIVDVSEWTDRRLQRRIKNRRNRPLPMVTVIKLRRPEQFGDYGEDGTWQMNYRTWVRSHWRRVHTLDGIKKVWIHSYLRGPDDKPIWQPHRVTTLER